MTTSLTHPTTNRRRTSRRAYALQEAEESFTSLITSRSPLALDGAELGHGLPARMVDLGELGTILLRPDSTDGLKDAVWTQLILRARTGDPDWVIGCLGVALPGLKSVAARTIRNVPGDLAEDIVSEMVTEFISQLARIDLSRGHICTRLMQWARKGALRVKCNEARDCQVPETTEWARPYPRETTVDPVMTLAEAVRAKVISPSEANLINATRLQGIHLTDYARIHQISVEGLFKSRIRAESRLAAAIADGQVSVITAEVVSDQGPETGAPFM